MLYIPTFITVTHNCLIITQLILLSMSVFSVCLRARVCVCICVPACMRACIPLVMYVCMSVCLLMVSDSVLQLIV